MDRLMDVAYSLLDRGLIPDLLLRIAIRYLCTRQANSLNAGTLDSRHALKMHWIECTRSLPYIAAPSGVDKANAQHYEVPTAFILSALGPRAKYSCCLYPTGRETLAEAEIAMLDGYCEKAGLEDGMDVLDLGCGWGSLGLYLAEKYPKSRIVGLSNSRTQKAYIDGKAKEKGLTNIEIITGDVSVFDFDGAKKFDRILSIEMFEHMNNYALLLRKLSTWLKPSASSLLFVHIFCHKSQPYDFPDDDGGWMAQTFFSGGTMPSHDLLAYFQSDLVLERSWWVNGNHYARTCEDWLALQDKNGAAGLRELERDAEATGAGKEEGRTSFYRFRVFFMACAEFFALRGGEEWGVGMYVFKLPQGRV